MEARMLGFPQIRTWIGLATILLFSCVTNGLWAQSGSRGLGGGGVPGPTGPDPQQKPRYVPTRFAPSGPRVNVAEVRLKGRYSVSESRIRAKLQTRAGRQFDPITVQSDVRQLLGSGFCYDVKVTRQNTPKGVIITYELFEQPTIQHVRFEGASIRDRTLLKKTEVAVGQPLSRYRAEEARRKLEEYYRTRGNAHIKIDILEGLNEGDRGIVFQIEEGPRQRIRWTKFEGNTIATDSRLRTLIASKPGILWLLKGQVDHFAIDEDIDKLTSYYRSLGFFRAQVTKDLKFNDKQEWLTLTFHIDEGPRYVIRNIEVDGNDVFDRQSLLAGTTLKPGDYFDLATMNTDVAQLKDSYGANGYIKVDVKASPLFYEEPGQLDLVYKVTEGKQYRVGNIIVNIDGEHPHTRESVVLNRIDMREGDIIDIRKLRASERRLTSSQLFETGPMARPEIAVQPRDPGTRTASGPRSRNR